MTPSQSVELEASVERVIDDLTHGPLVGCVKNDGWEGIADEAIRIIRALSASNARALAAEEALRKIAVSDPDPGDAKQTYRSGFDQGCAWASRIARATLASMKEKGA